ncbi:MAG: hypothetical protein COT33_00805 [Candidatus Nealsonbacteria bacterium CG08_land_8_20_14_0_20_38_20]|uniref:ATPase BadF/BadG/BcrA/BcrD type domain-containing protein n=1 Tax=Candidatus Nealsonbacteria bacterium CG08_land_8_20_14_0_20_38_20 TaxID=1974705 RepID=A0A2H0YMD8_9BACT|nr:MAG: hypothetical protein COT33_00805 [Candidatus Nealsonbacteria bacterium CG08_land_8_20_14_0_20_38_20]
MRKNQKIGGYVIGVDGGGAKTFAALADLEGKIIKLAKTGSSSPRNLGIKKAIDNLALAIKRVLPRNKNIKILATFLGLPTLEEEFRFKKHLIKKELLKHKEISPIFKGKVIISSDQLAGFRSGTDRKDGICLIAGSGQVVHGWFNKNEAKVSGWGYLTERGSAFWVGQKGLEAIWQELDGSGHKTLITKLVFKKLKIKNQEDLLKKVYSKKQIETLCSFSILVDKAARKGDRVAKKILVSAGKELSKMTISVIKKLIPPFTKKKAGPPLVLIGGMFKSKILLETVKKEIKKFSSQTEIILPKVIPAIGAVKLAIEEIKK